ncbi:MAG: DUF899 family protein [Longimicrobiales bacterium]
MAPPSTRAASQPRGDRQEPAAQILSFAEERGWRRLPLLSSATNTYNRDYHGETADGSQMPMLNVFQRDGDTIRHFWGSELLHATADPGQDPRHVGTSSRSGTCSTSRPRDARPIGRSSWRIRDRGKRGNRARASAETWRLDKRTRVAAETPRPVAVHRSGYGTAWGPLTTYGWTVTVNVRAAAEGAVDP